MPRIDCLIASLSLIGLLLSLPALSNETVIESDVLEQKDTNKTYFVEPSDKQAPSDTSMLFHIPGLTVTENNGPLGKSEIRYRGLAGSRLKVDIEGLSLNNPLFGLSDANAMFLFAAQEIQASSQSLSISLPKVDHQFAKGIVGYGSYNSFKLGTSFGTPLGKYSRIFVASLFSSTDGSFAYANPDILQGPDNIFYRQNNDQRRFQAILKFEHCAPSLNAYVLAAFNSHDAALPGFAFSPTLNLRTKALFAGLSAGFNKKIEKAEFKLKLSSSLFKYESSNIPEEHEKFLTSTHELNFSIDNLSLPEWLDMELGQILIVEHSYDQKHSRIGGGLFIRRDMRFKGSLKPRLSAYFNMIGYEKHGLLFKKDFALTIEPSPNISVTAGFSRVQRLPTFMELYAHNRFFIGNENLKKESIWDFQIGSHMQFGNHTRLQITGLYGFLTDLIVYEPFMASKVRPKNIDRATRYGIDLGINYEPHKWVMLESKNSLLRTKVKATNSPLPQSPAFLGLTRLRVGPADMLALSLQSRYRTASFANDYGSKATKGYILFDALLSGSFAEFFTLSLSVTNIFNVKHARDTYEMPLPGTIFFGQIEVGNS
jgi:outer membrane cobalamin receptor